MNLGKKRLVAVYAAAWLCIGFGAMASQAQAQLLLSQVYPGGGSIGAPYVRAYIEAYNPGPADITIPAGGWSVQAATATGTAWSVTTIPAGTVIPAFRYLLISESAGTVNPAPQSSNLPTADVAGTIAQTVLTNTSKVALVSNTTALTGATPAGAAIIDFVGFGTTTTWNEPAVGGGGFAAANNAPGTSNALAIFRRNCGANDTNNNKDNWANGFPSPRNLATPANGGIYGIGFSSPNYGEAGQTLRLMCTPRICGTESAASTVTVDTTGIGGAAGTVMNDAGANGDEFTGDGIYSVNAVIGGGLVTGTKNLPVSYLGNGGETGGSYVSVEVLPAATPDNDNCSTAQPIAPPYSPAVSVNGNLTGATVEYNPIVSLATAPTTGMSNRRGLWYTVTGTGTTMQASLCNSAPSFDSVIIVMCGTCDGLTVVTNGDDNGPACATSQASANWCSIAGKTYYVWVASFSTGATINPFTLTIADLGTTCSGAVICDTCSPCTSPNGTTEAEGGFGIGNNDGCDSSPNLFTDLGSISPGSSVSICGTARGYATTRDPDWYKFLCGSSGTVNISMAGQQSLIIILEQLSASGGCPATALLTSTSSPRCGSVSLSGSLTGGTFYALRVIHAPTPTVFGGVAPGGTSYAYSGTIGMPNPEGACCSTSANGMSNNCQLLTASACAMVPNSVFKGPGSDCSVVGANCWGTCCTANPDLCQVVTSVYCASLGGVFGGDGTTCTANPCRGACCTMGGGACTVTTASNCTTPPPGGLGGCYSGNNSSCSTATFTENFDGVSAPALPAGWSATNAVNPDSVFWVTSTVTPDTAPNDAFINEPTVVSDKYLVSPMMLITASGTISFRNNFALEASPPNYYDGGVLEISIGGGAFADIITAGGSFVTGGYTGTISINFSSPIMGRMAWSGDSGGYITTTVNLPPAAIGQNVQFRWRMASDTSATATGWRIDTIRVSADGCPPGPCQGTCTVTCPSNGVSEPETNCAGTNDGCAADGNLDPISCGQTVCGTLSWDGTRRDQDWYILSLSTAQQVTVTGNGEMAIQVGLYDNCGVPSCEFGNGSTLNPSAGATPCHDATFTKCLPAGLWAIVIRPTASGGDPPIVCGMPGSHYTLSLTCAPCMPATGACCIPNQPCQVTTQCQCTTSVANGGLGGNWQGAGSVCGVCPPPNDTCANAILLGVPSSAQGSTTGASPEITNQTCTTTDGTAGAVWYRVIGTGNTITATTCNAFTNFDTKLRVWCTTCNPLVCVAGNDDGGSAFPACELTPGFFYKSRVSWCSRNGASYLILVHGFGANAGNFQLDLSDDGIPCTSTDACGERCNTCPGDMTGADGVNGADAQGFVACVLNPANGPGLPISAGCGCADVDGDNDVDFDDVAAMVIQLLHPGPCGSGACCTNGACQILRQAVCTETGGAYQGNGTVCTPNPCPPPPCIIPPGVDSWITPQCSMGGASSYDFAQTPVPAGFFGPGSDPFTGVVQLQGAIPNLADTMVQRLAPASLAQSPLPSTATIPIQLVALDLVSCQPIMVTFNGGMNPQPWNVVVALDGAQPQGTMAIHKTTPIGGYFDSSIPVKAKYTFNKVGGGGTNTLSPGAVTPMNATSVPWTSGLPAPCGIGMGDPFQAATRLNGTSPCCVAVCHDGPAPGHLHCVAPGHEGQCSPCPSSPDNCSDALNIPCGTVVMVNNSTFTTEAGDPLYSCHFSAPGQGVGTFWLKFRATATTAQVETCASVAPVADTLLAVYSGTCGAFTEIACNDDTATGCGAGTLLSRVCATGLTVGQTYYVQVSSYSASSLGTVSVMLTCPCPP